ncbi:MAG TPA: helix-turn-helix domain-containing protein, partial [Desulfobacteraceae bacterium]|nr:helix-turn-helix domain-containing protein [Desulfobacteraceae bacterium]
MCKPMDNIPKVAVLIEASRAAGRGLLSGIVKYINSNSNWACYREPPSYTHLASKRTLLSWLKSLDINGIIAHDHYAENIKSLINEKTPMVIASIDKKKYPFLPTFSDDGIATGKMAAHHLMERGMTNFAYYGLRKKDKFRDRGKSFSDTVKQAGYRTYFYEPKHTLGKSSWENELTRIASWLTSLPKPVGVMTYADDYSRQIVEACKIAELKIPDEVAVIGVDNDYLICNLSTPPLSSVALKYERAGYEIAKLLDKLMNGEKMSGQQVIIEPTHVVTRQSTDTLYLDDTEVLQAIRFIYQNANNPLQVDDVVRISHLSRRALQQRFRKVLGHSIFEEIQRRHAERIAQILIETNLPISQIALKLGHRGIEHISR